jgi:hypothetical protein
MTTSQVLVWTTLPTGVSGGKLQLSVFLSPQLTASTPVGKSFAPLSLFSDFVDWPRTVTTSSGGPIKFAVTIASTTSSTVETVAADIVTPAGPHGVDAGTAWRDLFTESTTAVDPWKFTDYGARAVSSFSASTIANFVGGMYGAIGVVSPTDPITLKSERDNFGAAGTAGAIYETLKYLLPAQTLGDGVAAVSPAVDPTVPTAPAAELDRIRAFHAPIPQSQFRGSFTPETPTLDFHQGVAGLADYPTVLRLLHLVFDLSVPIPEGLGTGSFDVWVTPTWHSALGASSLDFTPKTAATLSATKFRPTPAGPDYANGMLGLDDVNRFTVTGLDMDLAADRLDSLSAALQTQQDQMTRSGDPLLLGAAYFPSDGASTALTVPALRSSGLSVLWSCYATSGPSTGVTPLPPTPQQDPFGQLLSGQADIDDALTTWRADPIPANLPVLHAEQIIRGHRFDVYTASDPSPQWRSLCGRIGHYTFAPHGSHPVRFTVSDEGTVTPAASQRAGTTGPAPTTLYVHESIVRWPGWGLSAQRPGKQVTTPAAGGSANRLQANPENLPRAPSGSGPSAPQLSAYFTPPTPSATPKLLYPKLRFGNSYRLRARAVDLAGNSLSITTTDASTATALTTHLRYEPARPPVPAGVAPFGPGEATLYLVLLDDQVHAPGVNGRWLFPPKASELLAEEHGMLDGFVAGHRPSPGSPPSGKASTYDAIKQAADATLADAATTFDKVNHDTPYFVFGSHPKTPWLPDPVSSGPALSGLPGISGSLVGTWSGVWPSAAPVLVRLRAGSAHAHYTAPSASAPGTFDVTLPKAEAAVVRVSSSLHPASLDLMGVYKWMLAAGGVELALSTLAKKGRIWLLSPFQVLRMVHAVRLPLVVPALGAPATSRNPGATSVDITDPQFSVDERSTAQVDVVAQWTDPYDNPADPKSNPGDPAHNTLTSSGPAFRLSIPDPQPTGPEALPLSVAPSPGSFSFGPSFEGYAQSATHHVGDTRHHTISYSATATSRFADLFQKSVDTTMSAHHPVTIGEVALGVQTGTVAVTLHYRQRIAGKVRNETVQLEAGTDFSVDTRSRTVTLLHGFGNLGATSWKATIIWQPVTTVVGQPTPVEVLSSAAPKAPVISGIVPAWQLRGPSGKAASGISMKRTGGFLRVYLDRPWYSSGAGEMLGVVTTVTDPNDTQSTMPSLAQQAFVTMMGLDPINYLGAGELPWPVVPTTFANLGQVPDVPYRPRYTSPPQVYLAEDDTQPYQVWPYEVAYDEASERWFADVAPRPGVTQEGTWPPPPGYFIRLALVRFQPWSEQYPQGDTVEVSPVVTATIVQPVADRTVSVIAYAADKSGRSVSVTVSGPGYLGWRPPGVGTEISDEYFQYDLNNVYAPQDPAIYDVEMENASGSMHTSTVVVEVQVQDVALNKLGITGDLGWKAATAGAIVQLPATFPDDGSTIVTWGGSGREGLVFLPDALSSNTKMRLRISEIDYYAGTSAPTAVDTTLRRPFVSLIPLN